MIWFTDDSNRNLRVGVRVLGSGSKLINTIYQAKVHGLEPSHQQDLERGNDEARNGVLSNLSLNFAVKT